MGGQQPISLQGGAQNIFINGNTPGLLLLSFKEHPLFNALYFPHIPLKTPASGMGAVGMWCLAAINYCIKMETVASQNRNCLSSLNMPLFPTTTSVEIWLQVDFM